MAFPAAPRMLKITELWTAANIVKTHGRGVDHGGVFPILVRFARVWFALGFTTFRENGV